MVHCSLKATYAIFHHGKFMPQGNGYILTIFYFLKIANKLHETLKDLVLLL